MDKIDNKELKKILVDMLQYINEECKNNNINYSVVGGTAIGAIREKGFIPWDDDVDIGLLSSDYKTLKKVLLKGNNKQYKLLYPGCNDTYYFPFMKLVDTRTLLKENDVKEIEDYGVYIDIFEYNKLPHSKIKQLFYRIKMTWNLKVLLKPKYYLKNDLKLQKLRNIFSKSIKLGNLLKKIERDQEKYNNIVNYNKLIPNWTTYSYEKETVKKSVFDEFIEVKFENINVMITKEYNDMLTNTYGDYMTPPEKKDRVSHDSQLYWKKHNDI